MEFAIQKNSKIRFFFKRIPEAVTRSSILFFGISCAKKKKKMKNKRTQSMFNKCRGRAVVKHSGIKLIKGMYKNFKLFNYIEWNPGSVYVNELPLLINYYFQLII